MASDDQVISLRNEFAAVQVAKAADDGGRDLLWVRDVETGIEVKLDAFFLSRLLCILASTPGAVPDVITRSIPGDDEPRLPDAMNSAGLYLATAEGELRRA